MAKVFGSSGAWQAIVDDLSSRDLTAKRPDDLIHLLASIEASRQDDEAAHREHIAGLVAERTGRIAALAAERGFFRWIANQFRKAVLRSEIRDLEDSETVFARRLEKRITLVSALTKSRELAGAKAELAVIDQLSRLSDAFVVYNDVRLHATYPTSFKGVALRSAQLDHVVLSPAGVFVIETKHWSPEFVASGAFHDPFDQTARASYLCRSLLRSSGYVPVRSVIAYIDSLPPQPQDSCTKTVKVEGLAGYIRSFSERRVSQSRLEDLGRFFRQYINGGG